MKKIRLEGLPKGILSEIFFQKMFILVFEVIVQPPKHTLGFARLPQRLKLMFFKKNFFTPGPLWVEDSQSFGNPPLEFFSKNVDFSLWGKQCIVLTKWTFFYICAHCVVTQLLMLYLESSSNFWSQMFFFTFPIFAKIGHRYLDFQEIF